MYESNRIKHVDADFKRIGENYVKKICPICGQHYVVSKLRASRYPHCGKVSCMEEYKKLRSRTACKHCGGDL